MARSEPTPFPADLPILGEPFKALNLKIQERDRIICEGRRPKRELFGLFPGWQPVGLQERYQELDALIAEARQLPLILQIHIQGYQSFFSQVKIHIRSVMTEACRHLLAAEGKRLQLQKDLNQHSDPELLSEVRSQQAHLRRSVQVLGQSVVLLLAQVDQICQSLETLISICHLHREALDQLTHSFNEPTGEETKRIPNLEILIQVGLQPLQAALKQTAKIDRDLLRSMAEIQAITQRLESDPAGDSSHLPQSEDQLLAALLSSNISRDDLVAALREVQAGSISLYFDFQQQLTAYHTSDQIQLQKAIENLQIFVQEQLGIEDSSADLRSYTTGIDYSPLAQLLQDENWREADRLTQELICEVVDRGEEGWLREMDVDGFPGEDLGLIDQLWVHHSQGQLGFSIQKKIWRACGSPGSVYQKYRSEWIEFGQWIHWQGGKAYDGWRHQHELEPIFPQKYPGHLPSCIGYNTGGGWGNWWVWGSLLAPALLVREDLDGDGAADP